MIGVYGAIMKLHAFICTKEKEMTDNLYALFTMYVSGITKLGMYLP